VPHALQAEGLDPAPLVLLGPGPPPEGFDDVLITLAAEVPECFSRFRRVAEIVGPAPADKEQGRARFRFYRDRGYALQTHNL
jgi:DNA polymerase-3 subunit chi